MKQHVQAAVIGGGVVGASVLYHLTKAGWRDVVLIERNELTSGSTWHAAGGMHTINSDPNVAKLQEYTIKLYKEIEEISGQSCGVHLTAGISLAGTRERMDWLKLMHGRGRYLGLGTELVTPDEAAKLFPLMDKSYFVGGLYNPLEGHVDPAGVTQAYAKAARIQGAEIYRFNRVTELQHRPDGSWDVVTEQGTIHAEHIVNAGGLWAREIGRMVGLELPVLAMEHHYLITEEIPEVVASEKEVLHVVDPEGEIYMRQEGRGMLMGTYEKAATPWSERTTPWDFTYALLPSDIDRIAPSLEVGFKHFPPIGRAGIKKIVNGPFTFAPDGNPLVGPVRGLKNYWSACAVMAGFSQGGGVGLALSNWMVNGDPGFDVWAMDISRFGDWATMAYTNAKVRENYSRRFSIRFPNEELTAARPLRTTPIYDRLKASGRGVRRHVRPRIPAVVRARRHRGRRAGHLQALQLPRAGRGGVPDRAECRRPHRDLELRQIRGQGSRRRGLALPHAGEPHAASRPYRADADAEPSRQADRRFHRRTRRRGPVLCLRLGSGRGISFALVRDAPAGARRRPALAAAGDGRALDRRAAFARADAAPDPYRHVERSNPVPQLPRDAARHGAGQGRAPHLHRRSRLRDLGRRRFPGSRSTTSSSRRAPISGSGISATARRMRSGSRRASAPGRANTGRSTGPSRPGSTVSSI